MWEWEINFNSKIPLVYVLRQEINFNWTYWSNVSTLGTKWLGVSKVSDFYKLGGKGYGRIRNF